MRSVMRPVIATGVPAGATFEATIGLRETRPAGLGRRRAHSSPAPEPSSRRRLLISTAVSVVPLAACALAARRLTQSSWPLENANMLLVGLTVLCYFASFVLRSCGWQLLFPASERPDRARLSASIGAAAASGQVLPFRLDLLVKVATLRRLGGRVLRFEAIAVSVLCLGIVDAVALLPLSISATVAADSARFRIPLAFVVAFGLVACAFLLARRRLVGSALVRRCGRLHTLAERLTTGISCPRATARACTYLAASWTAKGLAIALLLAALGVGPSPAAALALLVLLCDRGSAAVHEPRRGGERRRRRRPRPSWPSGSRRRPRSTSHSPRACCSWSQRSRRRSPVSRVRCCRGCAPSRDTAPRPRSGRAAS